MAILGLAGGAVVDFAIETTRAMQLAHDQEVRVEAASGFMDAVALWPRADLDRHLGSRREGPWRLEIQRVTPVLYTATLTDSANRTPFLHTVLFRREQDNEAF